MLNPEQKMKDMFGFFKTSSIEPYRPGNPNRADEEDDRNNDSLSLLPHRGKAPEDYENPEEERAPPRVHHNNSPRKPPKEDKPVAISFSKAFAEAKSAVHNRKSIADVVSKTGRLFDIIRKASGESENTGGTSNTNASATNNTTNTSTTIISTDYVSGLRRDYQQMPNWRTQGG